MRMTGLKCTCYGQTGSRLQIIGIPCYEFYGAVTWIWQVFWQVKHNSENWKLRPNTTKSEPTQIHSVFTGFGDFNTITYNDRTRHLARSMTDNGNTSPYDIHLSHLQIAGGSESVLRHYQSFDIEFSGPEYFWRVKISTLNTESPWLPFTSLLARNPTLFLVGTISIQTL